MATAGAAPRQRSRSRRASPEGWSDADYSALIDADVAMGTRGNQTAVSYAQPPTEAQLAATVCTDEMYERTNTLLHGVFGSDGSKIPTRGRAVLALRALLGLSRASAVNGFKGIYSPAHAGLVLDQLERMRTKYAAHLIVNNEITAMKREAEKAHLMLRAAAAIEVPEGTVNPVSAQAVLTAALERDMSHRESAPSIQLAALISEDFASALQRNHALTARMRERSKRDRAAAAANVTRRGGFAVLNAGGRAREQQRMDGAYQRARRQEREAEVEALADDTGRGGAPAPGGPTIAAAAASAGGSISAREEFLQDACPDVSIDPSGAVAYLRTRISELELSAQRTGSEVHRGTAQQLRTTLIIIEQQLAAFTAAGSAGAEGATQSESSAIAQLAATAAGVSGIGARRRGASAEQAGASAQAAGAAVSNAARTALRGRAAQPAGDTICPTLAAALKSAGEEEAAREAAARQAARREERHGDGDRSIRAAQDRCRREAAGPPVFQPGSAGAAARSAAAAAARPAPAPGDIPMSAAQQQQQILLTQLQQANTAAARWQVQAEQAAAALRTQQAAEAERLAQQTRQAAAAETERLAQQAAAARRATDQAAAAAAAAAAMPSPPDRSAAAAGGGQAAAAASGAFPWEAMGACSDQTGAGPRPGYGTAPQGAAVAPGPGDFCMSDRRAGMSNCVHDCGRVADQHALLCDFCGAFDDDCDPQLKNCDDCNDPNMRMFGVTANRDEQGKIIAHQCFRTNCTCVTWNGMPRGYCCPECKAGVACVSRTHTVPLTHSGTRRNPQRAMLAAQMAGVDPSTWLSLGASVAPVCARQFCERPIDTVNIGQLDAGNARLHNRALERGFCCLECMATATRAARADSDSGGGNGWGGSRPSGGGGGWNIGGAGGGGPGQPDAGAGRDASPGGGAPSPGAAAAGGGAQASPQDDSHSMESVMRALAAQRGISPQGVPSGATRTARDQYGGVQISPPSSAESTDLFASMRARSSPAGSPAPKRPRLADGEAGRQLADSTAAGLRAMMGARGGALMGGAGGGAFRQQLDTGGSSASATLQPARPPAALGGQLKHTTYEPPFDLKAGTPYMECFRRGKTGIAKMVDDRKPTSLKFENGAFVMSSTATVDYNKIKYALKNREDQLGNASRYHSWCRHPYKGKVAYLTEDQLEDHRYYMTTVIDEWLKVYAFAGIAAYDRDLRDMFHLGKVNDFSTPNMDLMAKHMLHNIKAGAGPGANDASSEEDETSTGAKAGKRAKKRANKKKADKDAKATAAKKAKVAGGGKEDRKGTPLTNKKDADDKPICLNFNTTKGCSLQTCSFAHTCHVCLSTSCSTDSHKMTNSQRKSALKEIVAGG